MNKVKLQEIIKEIDELRKHVNELGNNSQGKTIENFIDKLHQDIIKAQNKIENIYTESNH